MARLGRSRAVAMRAFRSPCRRMRPSPRPYFTRPDEEQAYYDLTDPRYRNLSLAPYPLSATVRVSYRGAAVHLSQVVQTVQRIPGLGMEPEPLLVGPAISVTVAPSAGAVPVGAASFAFACTVHSNVKGPARGTLRLRLPEGWHSKPEIGRVLDGSRWRRPDRGLLGSPGFGEAGRAPHHGSRRISGQELRGRIPAGWLSGFAPLSLLPPRRLPRGGRGREDAGGLAHRLSAGHRRRRAAGPRESRGERPHSGRERRHPRGSLRVTTPSFLARAPTPCVPS